MRSALLTALLLLAAPVFAQEEYGAKGIFPVYETSGQWAVFDKKPGKPDLLGKGERFLVIGSDGAQLFDVGRTSGTYGGGCRKGKPAKLRAALLVGPRRLVGRPILGIHVNESFALKGSRAVFTALKSEVSETQYQTLGPKLTEAVMQDVKDGKFRFKLDEQPPADLKPESIQTKIDFGAKLAIAGLKRPYVFVEESQIGASSRRCLRVADGDQLIGGCAEMPRTLMAETELLQFVSYDPSGKGQPIVMAFTKKTPLWGDERWGFVVRDSGPRLFLVDAMDVRCRASF